MSFLTKVLLCASLSSPGATATAQSAASIEGELAQRAPVLLAQATPNNAQTKLPGKLPKNVKRSFDFAKADIVDIVRAISDSTGKNFIIPDKLKSARITILSPTRITSGEAYQVFLAALAANGLTLTRTGKFYRLIATKDAAKTPIPTCIGPDDKCPQYSDQLVTQLLRLKNIEAQQIVPVIKGLASKGAEVSVFVPSNAIIISEYARNLKRIRRMIDALDQPGFDDELQLMSVKHATAQEIADKLTQIFEVQARPTGRAATSRTKRPSNKASAGEDEDVQISKIIADERTNQLIIKANRRSFQAIRRLVEMLDVPLDTNNDRVNVYYLENAKADELASTLSSLAQGQNQGARRVTPRPNQAQGKSSTEAAVLFQGEVKISADQPTNSLIVVASNADYRALKRLIGKLDRPRRQVYVEAAILEVTVNDGNRFGLDWHAPIQFNRQDLLGAGPGFGITQSAFGNGTDGTLSPTLSALTNPAALLAAAGGSVLGVVGRGVTIPVGDDEITLPSFGVILHWLQSSSTANVLSTPHILTTDNEEASIEVGQRIPFQRGTALPANLSGLAAGAGGGAAGGLGNLGNLGNLFSSTERIDVSLKLTLTPHVNEAGKVRLEIDQQIEDVAGRENGQPITAKRSAKTSVVVDDQQTVVIGGLMRDKTVEGVEKIPLLGDIPLIGWLFKRTNRTVEKINLLLVLTPYIIRDSDDFQEIVERKMNEYEEFAATYYGHLPKYRAHINYARKNGPLAMLGKRVRKEMAKGENGGSGDGETVVSPRSAESAPKTKTETRTISINDDDNDAAAFDDGPPIGPDVIQNPVSNDAASEENPALKGAE